jgi:hypothetical protein
VQVEVHAWWESLLVFIISGALIVETLLFLEKLLVFMEMAESKPEIVS